MNTNTSPETLPATPALGRTHVVAACLAVLTREVHGAGLDKHDALDLLRDAPDKIDAALTRGPGALVVYRLGHFATAAEQEGAPPFGFCPGAIAELAAHIDAGAASLKKDA